MPLPSCQPAPAPASAGTPRVCLNSNFHLWVHTVWPQQPRLGQTGARVLPGLALGDWDQANGNGVRTWRGNGWQRSPKPPIATTKSFHSVHAGIWCPRPISYECTHCHHSADREKGGRAGSLGMGLGAPSAPVGVLGTWAQVLSPGLGGIWAVNCKWQVSVSVCFSSNKLVDSLGTSDVAQQCPHHLWELARAPAAPAPANIPGKASGSEWPKCLGSWPMWDQVPGCWPSGE